MNFQNVFNSKGKICVIAEKYIVAEEYAKVFSCYKKENYFEGDKYVIVWTNGHICTLYQPEDYDNKYKAWKTDDLPIIPNGFWIKVRPGKNQILESIQKIVERKDVTAVCIATDAGREGNLIGEYTLMAIKNNKKVYRVMINALNDKEIKSGFKNMKEEKEYKNMTLAAQARDEIDWLIGTNLSRAYSIIFDEKYYVGRCKTVILNFICKRENEINSFKSTLSYGVVALFKNNDNEYAGRLNYDLKTESEAKMITNQISKAQGKIENITRLQKSVEPDPLMNLNDLIRAVNRRFGYTADEVYYLAQKLYEDHKMISYSRTDSRYVKSSMVDDIKLILNCINIDKFKDKKNSINGIERFIKKCVNDDKVTDHTAIIPLVVDKFIEKYSSLNTKEKNIYDIIVENFINNFLPNYEYESIEISTRVNEYSFVTKLNKVIKYGWRGSDVQNNVLEVKQGDSAEVINSIIEKKLSKPKERYTDNTLFEVLENPAKFVEDNNLKKILRESGIGTNATRALLLQDLITDGYVVRDKKHIIPTLPGMNLVQAVKTDKLLEPFFTAFIEQQLMMIQNGVADKDDIIKEIIKFIDDHIKELKNLVVPEKKKAVIGKCPLCIKGNIVPAGDKGYGCTNLKSIGCRFYISKQILGTYIDENQVKKLIERKQTDVMSFNGSNGQFNARLILDGNKTKFKRD